VRWLLLIVAVFGCADRHHPDNFAGGAVHGPALQMQREDCRLCHGDDLTGGTSAVSCDGCHAGPSPTAWRQNCTFCHGGVETQTGAPPRNIDGTDLIGPFPAHTEHVIGSAIANAYDCGQCHTKANDVLSPDHVFDATPGEAENDFGSGLSPQASFDRATGTCSNVYCHGSGRADDGMIAARGTALACNDCHPTAASGPTGWSAMSGPHSLHISSPTSITCGSCHAQTTSADGMSIAAKDLHINGTRDVAFADTGITFSATMKTCTGSCHGYMHTTRPWAGEGGRYHPAGFGAGKVHGTELELQRQDCRGCHGATLAGGTSGFAGPSCDGCHGGPTPTAWRTNCTFCHGGGLDQTGAPPRDLGSTITNTAQSFVAHGKHVRPTMMAANDCTTCHRKPTDVMSMNHAFDSTAQVAEVSLVLDGRNPAATYNGTGTCANLYCHGNGRANGTAIDGNAVTCTSCHGGAANNRAGLSGNHRDHHDRYACNECHQATVATGSTVISTPALHVNLVKNVVFRQGGAYTAATRQCTNLACHGTETW
jgi:predicted CxxxxCH...CXXCH cytochrome family protein